jgi:hypothetical protein
LILVCYAAVLVGCDISSSNTNNSENRETGGDYGPVTTDMLIGATYTGRTGKSEQADQLTWTFGETDFQIKAGENGLPDDLKQMLLPVGVDAKVIEGNWSVDNDIITFTNISADGVLTEQEPRQLETFFTGVIRISAGGQYKFSRGQ